MRKKDSDNLNTDITDLFYSESNIEYLENVIARINSGEANLIEKELIEIEKID